MPLDLTRIKALCFDVDGTLRDTDDDMVKQVSTLLRRLRSGYSVERINTLSRRFVMSIENPGNFLQSFADRLALDRWLVAFENQLYRLGFFRNIDHYQMIPETAQMLASLHPHYKMAVVSARSNIKTMAFLDKFELTNLFEIVVTSQTCRHTKPYPDPILWAAEQMGVPSDTCLMIGDTTVDIHAGKAAGAQTVGVLCGFGEEEELRRSGADLIITQTADLVTVLLTDSLAG